MLSVGIAVLCAALSCQAFNGPVVMTSSSRAWTLRQKFQNSYSCARRKPGQIVLGMSAQRDETAVAPVNREDASQIGEREATTSNEPAEKLQSKPKKRKRRAWTPEEQAYLDKIADAPIIYKRVADAEFYPSVGYESAFPTLEESLAQDYTGENTVTNKDGGKEILMRVVIVGAGEEEGQFVKMLSQKGEGKMVGGMYLVWDPRASEASEELGKVPFVNIHELGTDKTRIPENVARHARFLEAHMLVAVKNQPGYPEDYIPRLKEATLQVGLTFVGPGIAAEVSKGDLTAFEELVRGTRAAVASASVQ
ncbi:unnamed protein product [Ascophyllum nodosum]